MQLLASATIIANFGNEVCTNIALPFALVLAFSLALPFALFIVCLHVPLGLVDDVFLITVCTARAVQTWLLS